MKKGKNYFIAAVGLLLAALGLYLVKTIQEPQGILKSLPYIFVGLGCGAFGNGVGEIVNKVARDKNPTLAKQIDIDVNDERNVMIGNMARARGYEMMTYVFGALLLAFALMGASYTIVLPFVTAYIFVQGYAVYQRFKIEREL